MRMHVTPDLMSGRNPFEKMWLHNPYAYRFTVEHYGKKIRFSKTIKIRLPKKHYTDSELRFIKKRQES